MRDFLAIAIAALFSLGVGPAAGGESPPPVVEVVARGLEFEAPAEVPAGWVTFHFRNESGMTHFALIERMPDGHGIADQQAELAPVFQQGMERLDAGDPEGANARFAALPAWFGEVVFDGGPGLLAPAHSATTTLKLEPGNYLFECYVKTNGVFHSYNPTPGKYGMVREFRVVPVLTIADEPVADLSVTVSRAKGFSFDGAPRAGAQVVAVHFADQGAHENFSGHDLHLARLAEDTDMDRLEAWMDWRAKGGLQTPAPVEFLGGTNEMPAGSTAYLHLDLEPGRYAWIAEVPEAQGKGMLKVFTVP